MNVSNGKKIDGKRANLELKELQAKLYGALKVGASEREIRAIHNEITTSFSARAIAVRKVTTSKGKKTSGIDKILGSRDEQKYEAITAIGKMRGTEYKAKAVKRTGIPKADGISKRPLGIPTMMDRAVQTLGNFALDVHQEHTANARSFGFRKGRNGIQAMNYAGQLSSGAGKRFILKVDIRKAYDKVAHEGVLENVPLNKHVLSEWLNAGIFEKGQGEPSIEGVPQGGSISPTILNCVLNGIESEIMKTGGFPIRYADDLAVFTKTQEEAEKAKEVIINFLKPRGLELNEGKSVIVPIQKGTDFLGFHIREYKDISRTKNPKMKFKQGIVVTKPATKAVENFRQKVKGIFKQYAKTSAGRLLVKLNPVLRGGANYYRHSSGGTKIKRLLGQGIFRKLEKGVYTKHRGKNIGKRVLLRKYFKPTQRRATYFNKGTFFGKLGTVETLIVDLQEILRRQENTMRFNPSPNPYNPEDYEAFDKVLKRRIIKDARLSKQRQKLLATQDGICPMCNTIIDLNEESVEVDHIVPKAEGGGDSLKNLAVLHKECHLKKTSRERKWRAYKRKQAKKLEANP